MYQRFKTRQLYLEGFNSDLPPSIPLILPSNGTYDFKKNELSLDKSKPRSTLKPLPEALEMLRSITKPVAVISICGPCRTGKSYILSRMLGSADAFALGHTMDPKTFGIWIGTTVLECDEFTLLLMDSEGTDCTEANARDDASILVLSVLLSSCLIYNSVGVPRKNDLATMQQFVKIAESIVVKQMDDESELKDHFPNFIWLLRDVHLIPTVGEKKVTPTEYLTKEVFRCGNNPLKQSNEDKVGMAIMYCFPNVECKTIRPPSSKPEVMKNIASNQECLDPIFNQEVDDVINHLCLHVREKRGLLPGSKVTGGLLAQLAEQYVMAVNDPSSIPCLSDMWSATIESMCRMTTEKLVQEYEEEIEAVTQKVGMPMEEMRKKENEEDNTTLFGIHENILQSKRHALIKQVGHFLTSSSKDQSIETLLQELERKSAIFEESSIMVPYSETIVTKKIVIGGSLKKYAERNYKASHDDCRSVFDALYKPIIAKTDLTDNQYTFKQLLEDLRVQEESYLRTAVGPAKWDVYKEKKESVDKDKITFEKLAGFRQKAFDDAKQLAEFDAKLIECAALAEQMNKDKESYEEKLEEMKIRYAEEMQRIANENSERFEAESERYSKLMEANMKAIAKQSKDNKEQMQAERKSLMDTMMANDKRLTEMIKELQSRPPQIVERKSGPCSLM